MPFANDIILGCVCLEVKQDEWKTLERKWEGKLFKSMFGWVRRNENKWWGLVVFSPVLPKRFLPKMRRKQSYLMDENAHV